MVSTQILEQMAQVRSERRSRSLGSLDTKREMSIAFGNGRGKDGKFVRGVWTECGVGNGMRGWRRGYCTCRCNHSLMMN